MLQPVECLAWITECRESIYTNPAHNPRRAEVRGRRGKRGTRKARNPRADWSSASRITRIRACPFDFNADNADPRIYAARMRADRRGSRRGLGVGYGVVPNADCALGYGFATATAVMGVSVRQFETVVLIRL